MARKPRKTAIDEQLERVEKEQEALRMQLDANSRLIGALQAVKEAMTRTKVPSKVKSGKKGKPETPPTESA